MRIPLIAGNWKMNTTVNEAIALVREMLPDLDRIASVETAVCPPFVSLVPVRELLKSSAVKLGAQNVFYEEKGAYTGEIAPPMLARLCDYVIIGHSERRQYFQENGEVVRKKIAAVTAVGLKPILCVGEKLAENEAGKTEAVVSTQLKEALAGIAELPGLIIAYEPIWAIGTGWAATGEQANDVIALIRRQISRQYNDIFAQNLRILYGGSVTAANAAEFLRQPEIDGALVGGASLKAAEFVSIAQQAATGQGRS